MDEAVACRASASPWVPARPACVCVCDNRNGIERQSGKITKNSLCVWVAGSERALVRGACTGVGRVHGRRVRRWLDIKGQLV